jgi:hypothetical protein
VRRWRMENNFEKYLLYKMKNRRNIYFSQKDDPKDKYNPSTQTTIFVHPK